MAAEKIDFVIEQGATFDRQLYYKAPDGTPINTATYSARMHIRETADATTTLLELTSANGRIELGGANGGVRLLVDAVTTAAITWTRGVYDLELVNGPVVIRLLQGSVSVSPEVTR